jgi:hypothetical protein
MRKVFVRGFLTATLLITSSLFLRELNVDIGPSAALQEIRSINVSLVDYQSWDFAVRIANLCYIGLAILLIGWTVMPILTKEAK